MCTRRSGKGIDASGGAETLSGLLAELATGSRAALIHDDREISAAELADRVARVAGGLGRSASDAVTA